MNRKFQSAEAPPATAPPTAPTAPARELSFIHPLLAESRSARQRRSATPSADSDAQPSAHSINAAHDRQHNWCASTTHQCRCDRLVLRLCACLRNTEKVDLHFSNADTY